MLEKAEKVWHIVGYITEVLRHKIGSKICMTGGGRATMLFMCQSVGAGVKSRVTSKSHCRLPTL